MSKSNLINNFSDKDFTFKNKKTVEDNIITRKSKNFWQDAWTQMKRNKLAIVGLVGLIIIILLALISPSISKYDYADQNIQYRNLPAKMPALDKVKFLPFDGIDFNGDNTYKKGNVNEKFWFGTDQLGRDLWARTWKGTQVSLFIGM